MKYMQDRSIALPLYVRQAEAEQRFSPQRNEFNSLYWAERRELEVEGFLAPFGHPDYCGPEVIS